MSSLNYIAILGRQPELGLVELESILGAEHVQPFGRRAALIGKTLPIDRLGGAVPRSGNGFAQTAHRSGGFAHARG